MKMQEGGSKNGKGDKTIMHDRVFEQYMKMLDEASKEARGAYNLSLVAFALSFIELVTSIILLFVR